MRIRLVEIRRHPVKGLGAEVVPSAELVPGTGLRHDRAWAIAHGASAYDAAAPAWVKRSNFVVVAHVPRLARATAAYSEASGRLTLGHPEAPTLEIDPKTPESAAAIAAWIAPLAEGGRPGPFTLAAAPGQAFTDTPEAHLSLMSTRSLAALSEIAGRGLDRHRFRGNLWVEGLAPWEEFDLIGREIALGAVRLRITEPIERCAATHACPATGRRDTDITGLLDAHCGHRDFGVAVQVIAGGTIAPGDALEL